MISLLKRKRKQPIKTAEEMMMEIEKTFEKVNKAIAIWFDSALRDLRDVYEKRVDQDRLFEENLFLSQIIMEAEKNQAPLEYSVKERSERYQKILFTRGKSSPNPYVITVEEHKNCLFLSVTIGEKQQESDNIISLYYDKVKKSYSEYVWKYSCNYTTKYHIKNFLFDVLKHVKEDRLHYYDCYMSEFKARDLFWSKEHVWMEEYQREVQKLEMKKEQKLHEAAHTYEEEMKQFASQIEEKKLKEEDTRKKETEKKEQLLVPTDKVFDEEVALKMKQLYHQVHDLFQKVDLLSVEQAHELERLYERDIQELWQGFIKLNEEKQKAEKSRCLRVLEAIETHLKQIEGSMKEAEGLDFERKMIYMERKYIKN